MLDCPQLKEKTNAVSAKESCFMKNLKWIVIGCVVGIVVIVGVVLLIVNATSIIPKSYKECWSNETVWNDIESLVIPDRVCNEESVTALDLSKYPKLKSVTIGDESFMKVKKVKMVRLNELQNVEIGLNSFTNNTDWYGNDPNRHFYLKNCPKLESLRIGSYSFFDYSVIEIENVDALEVIEMGDLNETSNNFRSASLELKSILIHRE